LIVASIIARPMSSLLTYKLRNPRSSRVGERHRSTHDGPHLVDGGVSEAGL